ncbi:MAG: Do family serine endopeptidase [Thermodesulfobacteriota bacterium]
MRSAGKVYVAVYSVLIVLFIISPLYSYKDTKFIPQNFSELAKHAEDAVVNIRTVKKGEASRQPFSQGNDLFDEFFKKFYEDLPQKRFEQKSLGSGFLIDSEGFIVTNNHVVEDAEEIKVKMKNGDEFEAEKIGTDPNTDLALIKISADKEFPYLEFGDSQKIAVGEWVVAIGSPFGLEQTVTAGIVSAKGRVIDAGPYDDFIQTDASINPGNSGGPLLNLEGEVIGVNTAILAQAQGIGFAIPSEMAENIIAQLQNNGEVVRGWLGVQIQAVDEGLAEYSGLDEAKGVYITEAFEGDPAEKSGIKSGDIIVEISGEKVDSPRELTGIVAGLKVGSKVEIKVVRNGKKKTFDVKIGKRGDEALAAKEKGESDIPFGIQIAELDKSTSKRLGVTYGKGVLVANLDSSGKAAKAGMRKWDVILQINHKSVNSPDDYLKIIENIKKGENVSFFVKQYNRGFSVIKLKK